MESDGSLWIAKFPSRDDRRDIGAWEKLVHDLAEFIQTHGARNSIDADLEQLFRRVLFNVVVSNTDDH